MIALFFFVFGLTLIIGRNEFSEILAAALHRLFK